jgi:HindVP restriction endonuclease
MKKKLELTNDKSPSLYGLKNSNRNFSDSYYWGKNQFNSSFPAALACYMGDKNIAAKYIVLDGQQSRLITKIDELPICDLFGSKDPNSELFFSFESIFHPFSEFVRDELETIDLVVKDLNGNCIRPIEIKLTTLPDNTTAGKQEKEYGAEIVIRSATMRYMALSIASSLKPEFGRVRQIFEPICGQIRDWANSHEIRNHQAEILKALEVFFDEFRSYQKPFLMQPIWKTVGKSASLAENCLDVFVWSDFALSRLFMDSAIASGGGMITRQQRAAFRLVRFLYEVSSQGSVFQKPIYDGMTYDLQNDKEFAISGSVTNKYMKCDRLAKPIVAKEEIKNIILGGGQKYLSPERRFDAIIYFSTDIFPQ